MRLVFVLKLPTRTRPLSLSVEETRTWIHHSNYKPRPSMLKSQKSCSLTVWLLDEHTSAFEMVQTDLLRCK